MTSMIENNVILPDPYAQGIIRLLIWCTEKLESFRWPMFSLNSPFRLNRIEGCDVARA